MNKLTLHQGHVLTVLSGFPANHFSACVTDPPYELGFMGKKWDSTGISYSVEMWREVLRVLKPGAHLLAFGGSRTYHRMACAIEGAGFEVRDQIMWLYGSGFPKSLDVSKAIDKAAGAEREVVGKNNKPKSTFSTKNIGGKAEPNIQEITAPATDLARQWDGWGTALKPAVEEIVMAQKPYTDKQLRDIIGSKILNLEAQLWSLLSAKDAEKSFGLSPAEYAEACDFAQWPAGQKSNTQAVLFAQMDMLQFELAMNTSLNIVWSWRRCWGEICSLGNTATTETETDKITDLKTLNCSLSGFTPLDIILAQTIPGGLSASASPAMQYFGGELLRLSGILLLSAQGSVTSNPPTFCQDGDAKPYSRPIVVARKPLEGTVVKNVLKWGCGGINVDGCGVDAGQPWKRKGFSDDLRGGGFKENRGLRIDLGDRQSKGSSRWPANVIHDGSDEVLAEFAKYGERQSGAYPVFGGQTSNIYGKRNGIAFGNRRETNSGSAARFFYCAKASPAERDLGCEGLPLGPPPSSGRSQPAEGRQSALGKPRGNSHPTVKPLALMCYLVRLITPPGGLILDPFMGSGSTLIAAAQEGFDSVGIDLDPENIPLSANRIRGNLGMLADVEIIAPEETPGPLPKTDDR